MSNCGLESLSDKELHRLHVEAIAKEYEAKRHRENSWLLLLAAAQKALILAAERWPELREIQAVLAPAIDACLGRSQAVQPQRVIWIGDYPRVLDDNEPDPTEDPEGWLAYVRQAKA